MIDTQLVKTIFAQANAIITGDHFVYAKKPDGWYHGSDYVNKDAIYPYVRSVSTLCKQIASNVFQCGAWPDVVVGPTVGGVALAQWVAHWLSHLIPGHEFLAVCADEEDVLEEKKEEIQFSNIRSLTEKLWNFKLSAVGEVSVHVTEGDLSPSKIAIAYRKKTGTRRIIKRGYDQHVKGKKCLIVEDVINSGATVQKTARALEELGAIVIGGGALCNRSGGKVTAETLGLPKLFSLLDVDMKMYKEEECPICKEKGVQSVRTDLGKGKEFLARIAA